MDSMTIGTTQVYFFERANATCSIEVEPDGHGWLNTQTKRKRI